MVFSALSDTKLNIYNVRVFEVIHFFFDVHVVL